MNNIIAICNTEIPVVEYQGQRVVTFAMIDKVHQRPEGTARKRFADNRERFIEGKHFYLLDSKGMSVFRTDVPGIFGDGAQTGALITERGYMKLVKAFTDDLAWDVQEQLVDGYFRAKAQHDPLKMLNDPATLRGLLLAYDEKVLALEAQKATLSAKIEQDAPKVEVYDDFAIDEKTLRSVRETAKEINTKESEFRARLVSNKIIFKNLHGNYEPYAEFIERGYLRLREEVINGHFCRSPAFTNKGVIWIRNHKSFRDSFVLDPVIKRKAA